MTASLDNARRQIRRAAGTVMAAFALSQLASLARQVLVANAFGTRPEMDAFNAANRIPDTLFNLIAGGALASAFIPTFTGLLTQEDRKGAWQLASSIVNLALIFLAALGILAGIFAPQIVRYVLAPGFAGDPAKEVLTIHLARIMLPSAAFFGLSGLVMGILNSNQVFFIPALTPAMYQLGMIFGVLALSPSLGIYGLAWGVVIGAALHLTLQIPTLLRQGGHYFPILGLKLAAVREVLRLMGPRLFGVGLVYLNFWVNTRLASRMLEGSVAAITVAFGLMLMPEVAIAQSIAVAAMPTLSAQFARGRLDEVRASLASSLRGVLLLSLPAALGLILLRKPLIILLYQRGEFTAHSTELVAWALLWYAAGLVGHSVYEVLARAFYALHDTKTPVLVGMVAMSLNVVFSLLFSAFFQRVGWLPHGGLALANSLATMLEMGALLILMRHRLSGLQGKHILSGMFQAALAATTMAVGLWFWLQLTQQQPGWLVAGGGVILGAAIYGLVALALGVKEARGVVEYVKGRFRLRI